MSSTNALKRFHPYSQNQANKTKILQSSNITQSNNVYKPKSSYSNENYEKFQYLNSNQSK